MRASIKLAIANAKQIETKTRCIIKAYVSRLCARKNDFCPCSRGLKNGCEMSEEKSFFGSNLDLLGQAEHKTKTFYFGKTLQHNDYISEYQQSKHAVQTNTQRGSARSCGGSSSNNGAWRVDAHLVRSHTTIAVRNMFTDWPMSYPKVGSFLKSLSVV